MSTLYLKLSKHLRDERGDTVFGLTVDENPSQEAQDSAAGPGAGQGCFTITSLTSRIMPFQNRTATGDGLETVVLSIEGCGVDGDPVVVVNMEVSLTDRSVFTIKVNSPDARLVSLTPALAPLATYDGNRCQALVSDRGRCRLERINRQWCSFHTDQKALLHDELLARLKPWYEGVREQYMYMRGSNEENIGIYNQIQQSLALRILITEVLYFGEEDDGHARFVDTTCKNLGNVITQLETRKSDGEGRVSITSQIQRYLGEAAARESRPASDRCWQQELRVKLDDVRAIRASCGPSPSVYRMFSAPDSTEMQDRLVAIAELYGNMPSWGPGSQKALHHMHPWEVPEDQIEEHTVMHWGVSAKVPTREEREEMRIRHEIREKHERGEELTAEEEAILNPPWPRRPFRPWSIFQRISDRWRFFFWKIKRRIRRQDADSQGNDDGQGNEG